MDEIYHESVITKMDSGLEIYEIILIYVFFMWYFFRTIYPSKMIFFIAVYGALFVVSAFRGERVGADTSIYLHSFSLLAKGSIYGYYTQTYEIGYVFLNKILYYFTDDAQILLVVCSFFTLVLLGMFFYKYSTNYYLSTVLFVGMGFYPLTFTAIRQWLSIAITCWGMAALWNRRRMIALFLFVFAGLFHTTALIFLFFVLFAPINKTKSFILMVTGLLIYLGIHGSGLEYLSPLLEGSGKFDHYIMSRFNTSSDFGLGVMKIILCIIVTGFVSREIYAYSNVNTKEIQKKIWVCIMCFLSAIIMLLGYDVQIISRASYNFYIFICLAIPFIQPKNKYYRLIYQLLIFIGSIAYLYQTIYVDKEYYIYTNIMF